MLSSRLNLNTYLKNVSYRLLNKTNLCTLMNIVIKDIDISPVYIIRIVSVEVFFGSDNHHMFKLRYHKYSKLYCES